MVARIGKEYMKSERQTIKNMMGKRGNARRSRQWKDYLHHWLRQDNKRMIKEAF